MSQQQQQPQQLSLTKILEPEIPTLVAILSLSNEAKDLQTVVLQELTYLEQHALVKPEIANIAKGNPQQQQTIVLAIKSAMRKNLTLDPNAGLVYVKTRKLQLGNQWVETLEIQETANGLLSFNRQMGRILDFTRPKVTKNDKGRVTGVSMRLLLPSPLGPRWEDYDYDESDFKRWATYSHKERSRNKADANLNTLNYANHLYKSWEGGIDPEFARAKCIRHSLKKLGTNPNEGLLVMNLNLPNEKMLDAEVAMAEAADENGEFAWHEEVNTTINNEATRSTTAANPGNSTPGSQHQQADDFTNDL